MSADAIFRRPSRVSLRRVARTIVRGVAKIFSTPVRLFLSVRRSMTGASVTLLLAGIISLNIVWGYPWTGMFAAMVTMLVIGWMINGAFRPNLKIDFALPASSQADQPFDVTVYLRNRGKLPAMKLSVGFQASKRLRRAGRDRHFEVLSTPPLLPIISPSFGSRVRAPLVGRQRGVHRLPPVAVESMFPFHFFRSRQLFKTETEIAITPRLMTGDEDEIARSLLDTLGGWSHRLLAGDALDYTGSREYEVGMPVRRWDFSSWARLGRPIVREFQSPSIQVVTVIIDTAAARGSEKTKSNDALERLLSLAATAMTDLCRRQVHVRMLITSDAVESWSASRAKTSLSAPDSQPHLISLASAVNVDARVADQRIAAAIDLIGLSPTLLLTSRQIPRSIAGRPGQVTTIRVDAAETAARPPHRKRSFRLPPKPPTAVMSGD